jgi:polyhydroxyalkanoate synthesis regulator phasin
MERLGQELMEVAKQAFQSTLDAATKVQQQTHQLMEELIRQGATAQEGGKRIVSEWLEQSSKQMQEFQRAAVEGMRKWEAEVSSRLTAISPASRQEVQELRQRVDELAKRIETLERR